MCNKCGVNEKYGRSGMCKECKNAYNKEHYAANKQYYIDKAAKAREAIYAEINALKESNPCVDCYEKFNSWQMDFDHLSDKEFDIGKGINYSRDRLMAEIAKCEVVCKNCHANRTRHRFVHSKVVRPVTPAEKVASVYSFPCNRNWCDVK